MDGDLNTGHRAGGGGITGILAVLLFKTGNQAMKAQPRVVND